MAPNPCCCCTLQTGTTAVAIVNIVLSVLGLIGLLLSILFGVVLVAASGAAETKEASEGLAAGGAIVLIVGIISILFCIAYLVVSIILLKGANERNYGKCRLFLIVTIIFLVFYILDSARDVYLGSSDENAAAGSVAGAIGRIVVGILIFLYELWVVHAFMQELRDESNVGAVGYAAGRKNDV